jgi:Hemerythrin HHE cation binding domain
MRTRRLGSQILTVLLASLAWNHVAAQPDQGGRGGVPAPPAVLAEHQSLRDAVARAIADGGAVGEAAKTIERTLTLHLQHEEKSILPLLALLKALVDGQPIADSKAVVAQGQQADRELPQLLREHDEILDGAKRLKDASTRDGKREFLLLADQLRTHALMDAQVLYPASRLVARHLNLRQGTQGPPSPAPRQR